MHVVRHGGESATACNHREQDDSGSAATERWGRHGLFVRTTRHPAVWRVYCCVSDHIPASADPKSQIRLQDRADESASTRFFVVTGGPGSGKSTLIEALAGAGYRHAPEAGRAIIRHQVQIEGPALPWKDPALFAEMMLSWDMRSFEEAQREPGIVLFDRAVPDVIGYLALMDLRPPQHFVQAVHRYRYNTRVFIAPPWPEIFSRDTERKQDFNEAVRTHDALARAYPEYGYELVPLPRAPLQSRMQFVIEQINSAA